MKYNFTQEIFVVLSVVNGPSSEIKWCEEDDQQDHVLKSFPLIWCANHRTAQDKCEPVEDNSHGEELVEEVGQEWEEDVVVAELLIMTRAVNQGYQGNDVTKVRFKKSLINLNILLIDFIL